MAGRGRQRPGRNAPEASRRPFGRPLRTSYFRPQSGLRTQSRLGQSESPCMRVCNRTHRRGATLTRPILSRSRHARGTAGPSLYRGDEIAPFQLIELYSVPLPPEQGSVRRHRKDFTICHPLARSVDFRIGSFTMEPVRPARQFISAAPQNLTAAVQRTIAMCQADRPLKRRTSIKHETRPPNAAASVGPVVAGFGCRTACRSQAREWPNSRLRRRTAVLS